MPRGSQKFRLVQTVAACIWALAGCGGTVVHVQGAGGAAGAGTGTGRGGAEATQTFAVIPTHNQLDLLFVVDDSGTTPAVSNLAGWVPTFIQQMYSLPNGFPDLHVGIVTADMGAPSNAPITCSATGDAGAFQTTPHWSCTSTPLQGTATYLAQNGASKNFTGDLEAAVQCLLPAGRGGCGFIQPLAALARALGADGVPPPAGNAGFLRPGAMLGIILLAHQDDCSTPAGTQLYSLAGNQPTSLADPLGPLTTYRCNRYGHICTDAAGNQVMPPLTAPDGGTSAALTGCVDNATSTGLLVPVDQLVTRIKALKADPDHQIYVSAIVAPTSPYGVGWKAAGPLNPQNPTELWPQVLHSCGIPGTDGLNPTAAPAAYAGMFGDPAVRITQFANEFVQSAVTSLCDYRYLEAMQAALTPLGNPTPPSCIDPLVFLDSNGQPNCTVVRHVVAAGSDQQTQIYNCYSAFDSSACWNAGADPTNCPAGASAFHVADPTFNGASGVYYAVSCPLR